ncbi:Hypothetical predicted protein [Xyrichtys novacula]|uniref:Uncharacterized protein n=1 Tax=Xyrichtys novacula TaxID=13765 RepID=A0AAV1F2Z9_XYRNO|nr:Hypothetical predicted protein [Xyrichtys novacula]
MSVCSDDGPTDPDPERRQLSTEGERAPASCTARAIITAEVLKRQGDLKDGDGDLLFTGGSGDLT